MFRAHFVVNGVGGDNFSQWSCRASPQKAKPLIKAPAMWREIFPEMFETVGEIRIWSLEVQKTKTITGYR